VGDNETIAVGRVDTVTEPFAACTVTGNAELAPGVVSTEGLDPLPPQALTRARQTAGTIAETARRIDNRCMVILR
jgi:hypothetical protein